MAKMINGRPYGQTLKGPVFTPCAPHAILARMGDKWTILVMSILALDLARPLRFSEIRNGIPGISQRMLTLTLKNLERDGFVIRRSFAEVPPRVEYEVTAMGKTMLPALEGFTGWIRENWQAIERSREAFDRRGE